MEQEDTYDTELIDDYLEFTRYTTKYPPDTALEYVLFGLGSEVGEVHGKYKKYLRDGSDYTVLQEDLKKELGDVLWYVFRTADEFNLSVSEILLKNVAKLQGRIDNDTIKGSGDDR